MSERITEAELQEELDRVAAAAEERNLAHTLLSAAFCGALIVAVAMTMCGCAGRVEWTPERKAVEVAWFTSLYGVEFVDVDGTKFTSDLALAPFSRLGEDVTQMRYAWGGDGSGEIGVGRETRELDQTAQAEALAAAVAAAMEVLMRVPTGV